MVAFRTLRRLLLRTVRSTDPWRRYPCDVPAGCFGAGAHADPGWYLRGESAVRPASVDEVQEWLLGCEYARDADLFRSPDHWQHPASFERLRKGDCEDFALWTWRKLVELGYEADLVAGRYAHAGPGEAGHAWVTFHDEHGPFLFDPVERERRVMVRPLGEAREEFVPEFAVDGRLRRYVYAGYLGQLRAGVPA